MSPRCPATAGIVTCLYLATVAGAARADDATGAPTTAAAPARDDLRWDAPRGCGSAARVRARLDALVGPGRPPVRARGIVRADGDGYALTLTFPDRPGATPREVRAGTCAALVDATAVVLSIATRDAAPGDGGGGGATPDTAGPPTGGPGVGAGGAPPDPRTPDAPGAPALDVPGPPGPEAPAAPSRRSARLTGRLSARGDVGSLPLVAAGVALGLDWGGAGWSVGAEARWLGPATASYQTPADAGARLSLAGGAVEGCAWPGRGDPALAACAVVEVGAAFGEGFGVERPSRGSNAWIAVGAAGRLDLALGPRVGLAVRLEALAPLHRPRFEVSPYGSLFRAAPVVGRLGVGLRWGTTGTGR